MRVTLMHSTIAPPPHHHHPFGLVCFRQPQHFLMQSRRNEGGEKGAEGSGQRIKLSLIAAGAADGKSET